VSLVERLLRARKDVREQARVRGRRDGKALLGQGRQQTRRSRDVSGMPQRQVDTLLGGISQEGNLRDQG
jgi:hypothetical protein